MNSHTSADQGFDRLQEMLLSMRIGEELRASEAARQSGLSERICREVLLGLERAGLMARQDEDRFIRRTSDS